MRLSEFAALVGENPRQIRYLIAEGFVPAPDGVSSAASYGERHEEAVREYQKLRAEGMRPSDIKRMWASRKRVEATFSPGIRLILDPAANGWTEPDMDALRAWIEGVTRTWLDGSHGGGAAVDTSEESEHAVG